MHLSSNISQFTMNHLSWLLIKINIDDETTYIDDYTRMFYSREIMYSVVQD